MINNNKVIAIIPARGGSKGIPKKNIKKLNGKPLIQYSIDIAKECEYIDSVIVSTDCAEIEKTSTLLGADVIKRPDYLSLDNSLVEDAIKYTLDNVDKSVELIVLLEPTSPMRNIELLNKCIEKLEISSTECVATFSETELPPSRIWNLDSNTAEPFISGSNPWLPRQELKKGYQLNGLVYGFKKSIFKKNDKGILTENISAIVTPRNISIDIDDMLDFKLVEYLMKENNG